MKNRELVLREFKRGNKLVVITKLYNEKFSDLMNEEAFSQIISRLYRSGEIEKVSKGIYYLPQKTRFGNVMPSKQEIVNQFIGSRNGIVVGYEMFNELGLTTQIPKGQIVYSKVIKEKKKQVGTLTIVRYMLNYTPKVNAIIQLMEVLNNYEFIQDLNNSMFMICVKKLAMQYSDASFDEVQNEIRYPKRTIAFLKEILDYYRIENKLDRYLSIYSDYNIPKIRSIYETA